MEPDDFQKAWRAQSDHVQVSIDDDRLRRDALQEQTPLRAGIFWQEVQMLGTALLILPVWFWLGVMWSLPWTWYLTVPALLCVAGFVLVDRMRCRQQCAPSNQPLLESVKSELRQTEHQIWLSRNLFWWYLSPSAILLPAFFVQMAQMREQGWWQPVGGVLLISVVYAVIYFLNERAVWSRLQPRRAELLNLLSNLRDENDVPRTVTLSLSRSTRNRSINWRSLAVATCCSAAIVLIARAGGLYESRVAAVSPASGGSSLAGLISDLR